ncbi:hypothetical protein ACLOJK_018207 [Asimina triloba]
MPLNPAVLFFAFLSISTLCFGEDPYRFFTWNVTYGDIYPLGVRQQGILINGQFPGPDIFSVTNDNLIVNVYNSLPEPFLISWLAIPSLLCFFFFLSISSIAVECMRLTIPVVFVVSHSKHAACSIGLCRQHRTSSLI